MRASIRFGLKNSEAGRKSIASEFNSGIGCWAKDEARPQSRIANSRDRVATSATHFLRESVTSVIVQQAIAQVPETYWKSLGRSHTDQPIGPLLKVCRFFVANSADCAGLPTLPTHKCCAVYNLRFELLWH